MISALIEETELRFDIVGNLPIELVLVIFKRVDLYQLYQCRRVSRKWLDLLCAGPLLKTILAPWRQSGDFQLTIPEGITSVQALDLFAEHEDAFRTGNAFSRLSITINANQEKHVRTLSCSGGYLAWRQGGEPSGGIMVHNIQSGQRFCRVMPDRQDVLQFAVSSSLLVAITFDAKCYIWIHGSDRSPRLVRLPSFPGEGLLYVSEYSVLIHMRYFYASGIASSFVVIQCAQDRQQTLSLYQPVEQLPHVKTQEFSFDIPRQATDLGAMIDKSGDRVLIFYHLNVSADHGIYIHDLNCQGKCLFRGRIASLHSHSSRRYTLQVTESTELTTERCFNIWALSKSIRGSEDSYLDAPSEYLHAVYYPNRGTVVTQTQKMLAHKVREAYFKQSFFWKGILYRNTGAYYPDAWGSDCSENVTADSDDGDPDDPCIMEESYEMSVMDLERETFEVHRVRPLPNCDQQDTIAIFGDETFIVRICGEKLDVMCFDKYLQMASEIEDFRTRCKGVV